MHRFYHLARYNLGLSPLLNGTGFMVRYDIIKEEGWNTKTLTEDIEFSLKRIIKGKKLGWATDAIVYDEQPTSFKQSWSQRSRWTVGHIQCIGLYTKDLFKAAKRTKSLMNVDGVFYILGSIPMFIISLISVFATFIMYLIDGMTIQEVVINIIMFLLPMIIIPMLTALFAMWLEKKPIKPMIKGLLGYPIFLGTWMAINFKCLFKRQTTWEKINHVRSIKIDDVN
jgi:cellulose synthase/poly-beta-1,6-N-acetylglucosamine synthase-like glycosyltransferase